MSLIRMDLGVSEFRRGGAEEGRLEVDVDLGRGRSERVHRAPREDGDGAGPVDGVAREAAGAVQGPVDVADEGARADDLRVV